MNEEIKELIDNLKMWIDSPLDEIDKNYGIWELNFNQIKELLNYINQLQKENQKLKEQNKSLRGNIKVYSKKSKNRYDEIINLKKKIVKLERKLQQRDEVIGEAIKFINETWWYEDDNEEDITYFKENYGTDKLLEILQKYKGDNNE